VRELIWTPKWSCLGHVRGFLKFYLQRAPGIVFNTLETSVLQLLGGPQVLQLLEDYGYLVETVDQLVKLLEILPSERSAIVD